MSGGSISIPKFMPRSGSGRGWVKTPLPLRERMALRQQDRVRGRERQRLNQILVRRRASHPLPATPQARAPPSPVKGEDLRITKDAIFAYCYAVLHDPLYREKYALNLKREFPRIPFYPDFDQWAAWGAALLKLHIDYEKVKPAKLTRVNTPAPKRAEGMHPKPKLKSLLETGVIVIDEDTQLAGIPAQAWDYRLGNRSAIDWVLDQHKAPPPRDPTISAKFNTYRIRKAASLFLQRWYR
jgi:Type ISP C-terminal specificity domain